MKENFLKKFVLFMIITAMTLLCVSCKKENSLKKEIIMCSYGADVKNSIPFTLGAIEKALQKAYPKYKVDMCFTSEHIINYLKEHDNYIVKNMNQALDEAVECGIEDVVVLPVYFLDGVVLKSVVKEIMEYQPKFKKLSVADYLMASDRDFEEIADIVIKRTAEYNSTDTAICIAGHGTSSDTNSNYLKFQKIIRERGDGFYLVGTLDADPTVDDLIEELKKNSEIKNVLIVPLMIDGGGHITNDIASDEEDSWKSKFLANGYNVECVMEGLAVQPEIQQIFVRHAKAAM
jgi:sirohydrochlorin cobaltochelatase